jgi:hypothetical protein
MSELRRALTINRGWRDGHVKIRSFNINGDEEFDNLQSDHQQKPIVVKAYNGIRSVTIRGNGTLNFKAKFKIRSPQFKTQMILSTSAVIT